MEMAGNIESGWLTKRREKCSATGTLTGTKGLNPSDNFGQKIVTFTALSS
jgi:hypothetical protein